MPSLTLWLVILMSFSCKEVTRMADGTKGLPKEHEAINVTKPKNQVSEKQEKVDLPSNIAGTYLSCKVSENQTQEIKTDISCGFFYSENDKKAPKKELVEAWSWSHNLSNLPASSSIDVRETLPENLEGHVIYFLRAQNRSDLGAMVNNFSVSITMVLKGETKQIIEDYNLEGKLEVANSEIAEPVTLNDGPLRNRLAVRQADNPSCCYYKCAVADELGNEDFGYIDSINYSCLSEKGSLASNQTCSNPVATCSL